MGRVHRFYKGNKRCKSCCKESDVTQRVMRERDNQVTVKKRNNTYTSNYLLKAKITCLLNVNY